MSHLGRPMIVSAEDMGTTAGVRQPSDEGRPVVAFDFDGTLTCRDSYIAFLRWRAGDRGLVAGLAPLLPSLLAFTIDRDRGRLKARVSRQFLGTVGRGRLESDARRFGATAFARLLRPDALVCWRAWRARGACLFIVTASPEILVAPFAAALGADGLIGTRLAFDADDRFTGALEGVNCRGMEKVRRLRAVFGPGLRLEAAYGDSGGDREMLAIARTPGMKAFRGRP